jgi:sporulation protein YlmC with PRC-barrel domain
MAHYGTLRDYHFSEDIDDVRGATLYGVEHEKLGKVDDAVLDHDNGEIRYLIVDTGHGCKHMVPADRVYRSVADENDFDVNLRRSEVETLPVFDEKAIGSEAEWRDYERRYHESYHKWEQEQQRRYEEGHWH